MQHIGQSIAADRARLGLSQQELADRLGVSQQAVAKWEAGRAAPRGKRLSQLVSVMGKTSQTAGNAAGNLRAQSTRLDTMSPEQTAALQALADAAQQLARAAEAIAESVSKLAAQPPPPRKH